MKRWAALVCLVSLLVACSGTSDVAALTSTSTDFESPPTAVTSLDTTATRTAGPSRTTTFEVPVESHIRISASPEGLEMVIGPDGNPVFGFWERRSPNTTLGAMVLIRCSDHMCIGDAEQAQVVDDVGQTDWRLAAVHPDGRPVFLVSTPPTGSLFVCAEPACRSGELVDLGVEPSVPMEWTSSAVLVDRAGLAVIVAATRQGLMLVSCLDEACADIRVELLESQAFPALRVRDATVAPAGRVVVAWVSSALMGHGPGGEPLTLDTLNLSICRLGTCETDRSTVAIGPGWQSWLFVGADGRPTVVGFGDPWKTGHAPYAANCVDPSCGSDSGHEAVVERVPTATPPFVFDPDFPIEWWAEENPNEGGLSITYVYLANSAAVTGHDDLPLMVFGIDGRLFASHCEDPTCQSGTTHGLPVRGGLVGLQVGSDGLPLVLVSAEDELHLIRCRDAACTPPD